MPAKPRSANGTALKVIGVFKLVKALILVGVAFGALKLLNPTIAEHADRLAEIYELLQRVSWPRIATLAINLIVVGYLVWKVRQPPEATKVVG